MSQQRWSTFLPSGPGPDVGGGTVRVATETPVSAVSSFPAGGLRIVTKRTAAATPRRTRTTATRAISRRLRISSGYPAGDPSAGSLPSASGAEAAARGISDPNGSAARDGSVRARSDSAAAVSPITPQVIGFSKKPA